MAAGSAVAQVNLDIATPPIALLKHNMLQRQKHMARYFESGAIGIASDGSVEVRDPNAVPTNERRALAINLAKENDDRKALAREVAHANGRPDTDAETRSTLAKRWIEKAQPGWWLRDEQGAWVRK